MAYGSRGVSKFEYAACLAASLGYLMNRQRDGVGLVAFSDRIVDALPSSTRAGHLRNLLVALDRLEVGSRTNVAKPLHQAPTLQARTRRPDLGSARRRDAVIRGLKHFQHAFRRARLPRARSRRAEFPSTARRDSKIWSRATKSSPFRRRARTYLKRIGALIDRYRREPAGGHRLPAAHTSQPLEMALLAYLSTRSRTRDVVPVAAFSWRRQRWSDRSTCSGAVEHASALRPSPCSRTRQSSGPMRRRLRQWLLPPSRDGAGVAGARVCVRSSVPRPPAAAG
jgi:hypothetical protein